MMEQLLERLKQGDRRALARAITLVESTQREDKIQAEALMCQVSLLLKDKTSSTRIAFTGPPGAGKSTLIDQVGLWFSAQSHPVGVLAVDPSSPFTAGAIMGDKTRMDALSQISSAFIRPSCTASSLAGSLHPSSFASIQLMETAGFEVVLIEGIGAGQQEMAPYYLSDFMVLVLSPAAGDDLQGIKRGILELADAVVVTKADGETASLAQTLQQDYQSVLPNIPIFLTGIPAQHTESSASGIDTLCTYIIETCNAHRKSDAFSKRRDIQMRYDAALRLQIDLIDYVTITRKEHFERAIADTLAGKKAIRESVLELLRFF